MIICTIGRVGRENTDIYYSVPEQSMEDKQRKSFSEPTEYVYTHTHIYIRDALKKKRNDLDRHFWGSPLILFLANIGRS